MTTIAEIASHPVVRSEYRALAEAASGIATPQIRNVGTLGGNLCQRPRCWYYRHPLVPCLKKGGDRCYALAGHSKYLCVVGGERCYIVHPSDTAVALAALGADIEIAGPAGLGRLPIEQFFIGPGEDITRENILRTGEIVTRVHLPAPPPGMRSLYLKAGEREAGDFALASVAAAVTLLDNTVQGASVALGGVAPVPYRASQVEEYVKGRPISEIDPVRAGRMALAGATPMADNGYKVVLASNLVKQAITRLL
jgi:xanthine dehydrogenase YagS FAD-binding subunit